MRASLRNQSMPGRRPLELESTFEKTGRYVADERRILAARGGEELRGALDGFADRRASGLDRRSSRRNDDGEARGAANGERTSPRDGRLIGGARGTREERDADAAHQRLEPSAEARGDLAHRIEIADRRLDRPRIDRALERAHGNDADPALLVGAQRLAVQGLPRRGVGIDPRERGG